MRRMIGVGVVLLLAALLIPSGVSAQQRSGERANRLGQNYPNPFNPTTTIKFVVLDDDVAGGKPAVVTVRIRDILGRLVAIPEAMNHPSGNVAVENLEYTTAGEKLAYWNGIDRLGRKVASGRYLLELIVNGERSPPRLMVVAK
jgi:hypothetical protein